jgi:lipoprotein-anchoring transpeptidase ErfK/SrfK
VADVAERVTQLSPPMQSRPLPPRVDTRPAAPRVAPEPAPPREAPDPAPPDRSGTGHRVVFDLSEQRVWLVRSGDSVRSTYLVSGSIYDNLQPGHYRVYSRSEYATSYDYTSTMRWMVRFTEGATAAIGFHSIPRDSFGDPVQTWRQLGTPQSHGCIRQRPADAKALWQFAPIGTPVVVVA